MHRFQAMGLLMAGTAVIAICNFSLQYIQGYNRMSQQERLIIDRRNFIERSRKIFTTTKAKSKLWVSMGLCFNEGNEMGKKSAKTYAAFATFSVKLWELLADARVILWIPYKVPQTKSDEESLQRDRKHFEESLEGTSVVMEWVPMNSTDKISCATLSQMIRMFAFRREEIKPDDIVLTSDIDAFIMERSLVTPIENLRPQIRAWIFQYSHSVSSGDNEATFPMCFIALRSSDWQKVVDNAKNPQELNDDIIKVLDLDPNGHSNTFWYNDQWAATYGILRERFCTLPESSNTWTRLKLKHSQEESGCWHGGPENANCNIGRKLKKCLWWHFYPHETVDDASVKFLEIVGNQKFDVKKIAGSNFMKIVKKD